MASVINWRLEGEKIILSIMVGDSGPSIDVELPKDTYDEIIVEGPPSEETQVKELLKIIHTIRKKRLLNTDAVLVEDNKLIKRHDDVVKEIDIARKALKAAQTKLEVTKWNAVLTSCKAESQALGKIKAILQEHRHLIKLTHQEEAKYRVELLRKLRG